MHASEVDAAWAEVTARWDDEGVHRAFLDRFRDLEGLAEVGRRYRRVVETKPEDPVAARWRDEVVKRATVLALAQLPRTAPPRPLPPRLRRVMLIALSGAAAAVVGWMLRAAGVAGMP